MKNFNLFALFVFFTFIFSSCSTNETILPEAESLDLLKSYSIQRNASGNYLLDYVLNGNVKVDNVKDLETNTNEIYLYSSNYETSRKVTQDLLFIDGSQIKVGFVDTNSDQKDIITIKDDNSSLSRSESDKLKGFSVSKESDGTYKLNYTLNDGFVQDLVFNEDEKEYEVHLDSGKSTETEFTTFLEKQLGQPLKICFINNKSNTSSKSSLRRPKTPVVIID